MNSCYLVNAFEAIVSFWKPVRSSLETYARNSPPRQLPITYIIVQFEKEDTLSRGTSRMRNSQSIGGGWFFSL